MLRGSFSSQIEVIMRQRQAVFSQGLGFAYRVLRSRVQRLWRVAWRQEPMCIFGLWSIWEICWSISGVCWDVFWSRRVSREMKSLPATAHRASRQQTPTISSSQPILTLPTKPGYFPTTSLTKTAKFLQYSFSVTLLLPRLLLLPFVFVFVFVLGPCTRFSSTMCMHRVNRVQRVCSGQETSWSRIEFRRRVRDFGVWFWMQWKQRVYRLYYSLMNSISIYYYYYHHHTYYAIILILIMMKAAQKLTPHLRRQFSTSAVPQLTDWQYTHKIQQSLHQNNINEALRFLIQSYLQGKVLDMHIYRSFYHKAEKLKAGLSYEEIGYRLYREHFKPNILILDWMNALARSRNRGILGLLEGDFRMIKVDMPVVAKVEEDGEIGEVKGKEKEKDVMKKEKQAKEGKEQKPVTQPILQTSQPIPIPTTPTPEPIPQKQKPLTTTIQKLESSSDFTQIPNSIKHIIESITGKGSKITLHNVTIEYEDLERIGELGGHEEFGVEEDEEEGEEGEGEEGEDMQWIRKIRIQRIQITTRGDRE